MRRFFVGFLALIGFLVLLMVALGAAVWITLGPTEPQLAETSIIELDFDEGLGKGATTQDPLARIFTEERLTLREVLDALERGRADPRVKGLFARIGEDELGLAEVQELRDAIAAFRAAGKFAIAFAETFGEFAPGNRAFYLATAFDEIWLQPMGTVGLLGLRSETPFFRGTLDKLDIVPRLDKREAYKTAMDVVTERGMTPPHRENLESLLSSLSGQLVKGIAEGRGLGEAEVRQLVDNGPYLAADAVRLKLVDRLGYRDQALRHAREVAGDAGAQLVSAERYLRAAAAPTLDDAPVLALIHGIGIIQRGDNASSPLSGEGIMGADAVARAFREAIADPSVRGILFRVDSPGGSVVGSETVWHETVRAREAGKPVVVSMGDVAGSGGYYVAAAADKIVAQPATLTGSIGVVAGKILLGGLAERLGVTVEAVDGARNAGMFSNVEDFSEQGAKKLQSFLDAVYAGFTDRVASGRGIDKERIASLAQGRVWTGEEARANGLVDALGGYDTALALLKDAAGIPADQRTALIDFPAERSTLDILMGRVMGRDRDDENPPGANTVQRTVRALQPMLARLERALAQSGVLLMPPLEAPR